MLLLCAWLIKGGGTPDPFEKGFVGSCVDDNLTDAEEKACLIGIGFATGGGQLGSYTAPGVVFEMNLGQVARSFQYAARGRDYTAYLNAEGVSFDLQDRLNLAPTVLRAGLARANRRAQAQPLDAVPGVVNYLYGNDPKQWVTDIPEFRKVQYKNVYPGVDVVYYGHEGWIEHDFVVHPGADPQRIEMTLEGADQSWVDENGDLQVRAGGHKVTWKKPALYQQVGGRRRAIEGRYRLMAGNRFGFETGAYNAKQPLVIDPVITFSTLFGGTVSEGASRLAVDSQGNSYFAGISIDTNFPVTPGAFATASGGARNGDVYVVKMNATGSQRVYSTHIGGAFLDGAVGLAIDGSGSVYVAGATKSPDYPTTANVYQRQIQGTRGPGTGMDCVVSKLNAAGNSLSYSTYLGGTGQDACIGIAVDGSGSAYVTGWTDSTNFPVTDNAPQRQSRGGNEVFVTKLNPAGTALVWSTLMGGINSEEPTAITLDGQNNVFVVGHTNSRLAFPVTPGAYKTTYSGSAPQAVLPMGDAFVGKINADGSSFAYVTLLGGSGDEIAGGVAVDAQGNAYVVGNTTSTNFPTTAQAYRTAYRGLGGNTIFPGGDVFVTKLNPTGSALIYSTYLGGAQDEWATAVTVDGQGNAWVTGATMSTDFPVTQDAAQRTYGGTGVEINFPTGDAFVTQLNPTGSGLVYSTYLGGSGDDFGMGLVVDRTGAAYISGSTRSRNFPTTAGAAQTQLGGFNTVTVPLGDAFVVKLGDRPPAPVVTVSSVVSAASLSGGTVSPGEMVVVSGTNLGPATTARAATTGASIATTLAGARVLFDDVAAPVFSVSATQAVVFVPYGVAGKTRTQLVVEYNGGRSAAVPLTVADVHPGLFSANSTGRGQATGVNEDGSANKVDAPARIGQVVKLYATGLGQTDPAGVDGQIAVDAFPVPLVWPSVTVGGIPAEVVSVGVAAQSVAGYFELAVRIPDGVSDGDAEVLVTSGDAVSQSGVTVAVATPAPMPPPDPEPAPEGLAADKRR